MCVAYTSQNIAAFFSEWCTEHSATSYFCLIIVIAHEKLAVELCAACCKREFAAGMPRRGCDQSELLLFRMGTLQRHTSSSRGTCETQTLKDDATACLPTNSHASLWLVNNAEETFAVLSVSACKRQSVKIMA